MARERQTAGTPADTVISIIAAGMKVVGDCTTEGTLRIEGAVEGTVRAGKAVVIGKDGLVDGHVHTQDAVVGGRITGSLTAASRLELQATAQVDGEVRARRMQLEEGAVLNGKVSMGESVANTPAPPASGAGSSPSASTQPKPETA